MDILACGFNPGQCFDTVIRTWLDWFPFGSHGLMFATGMIVGAILGKWGVAAVFAALVALKFANRVPSEKPPVPQKRKK